MPTYLRSVAALKRTVSDDSAPMFVRWSRGPALDRRQGQSRDYTSGHSHSGLSAVRVNPEWADDTDWLAGRITEYGFLTAKDDRIRCHIYTGAVVGRDSDGYDLIADIGHVATLSPALALRLDEIKFAVPK